MKDTNELNLEIELIKKDINDIKNNHLQHIEVDMRDVKIEIFRFKYIVYGAVIVFALLSDNIERIINLFQENMMAYGYGNKKSNKKNQNKNKKKKKKMGKC